MLKKSELKKVIFSTFIVAILFVASALIFQIFEKQIQSLVASKSIGGMIIYLLIFIFSIIFVPISSMPLIPIGSKIWGVLTTTLLSTIGWTIGAMIAFYLARKFGRPYVTKLIGVKKIEKIEKLIPEENIFLTIFFLRAVTPFDGLSYALGLITRVKTKTFFWATLLGLLPFCFVIAVLGSLPAGFLAAGLALAAAFFIIGIYRIK